ncbi:MAG: phospholipase D-like domain-containing protein [Tannerellaceae bacterium]|nr:phospholipase D-like domain-containing protein [Tannerellaceae bacterium]
MTRYIKDTDHYSLVLELVKQTKTTLWIGTSDLKDLYVKQHTQSVPLLGVLAKKLQQGVSIRLIHAKEPGLNFRNDFDKYPVLWDGMERLLCPRVHFKLLIFDLKTVYIGSANLTGAGLGMKGEHTRNFEAGILTDDTELVRQAIEHFDAVRIGRACRLCKRKTYCKDPAIR